MSKAVFLRPHNIYPDYEGDWIQVDKKKIVNAVSHKGLEKIIKDNSDSSKNINNLKLKQKVTIIDKEEPHDMGPIGNSTTEIEIDDSLDEAQESDLKERSWNPDVR